MAEPKIYCAYTELRSTSELREHPRNPNNHPHYQIDRLAEIIELNGWRQPVVVSDKSGYIIKGHCRYQAAKSAGFEKIPVEVQHYESTDDEIADLIMDNYMSELSMLNNNTLPIIAKQIESEEPEQLPALGFTPAELEALLKEDEEDLKIPVAIPIEHDTEGFKQIEKSIVVGSMRIYLQPDEAELFENYLAEFGRRELWLRGAITELLNNGDHNYKWHKSD